MQLARMPQGKQENQLTHNIMAISEDKNRLYVDSSERPGITRWQIAQCLRDYRVTRLGRDLGLLCTSPNVNLAAKYRPINSSSVHALTDEDRAALGWGVDVSAEGDANDDRMHYLRYSKYPLVGDGVLFRTLDFNGYNHAAKNGLAFTNSSVSFPMFNNINVVNLKANADTGDNIAFPLLPDILRKNFYYPFENFSKFGIEVRSNTGCIVNDTQYASYDAFKNAIYGTSTNNISFGLNDHPTGYGAKIYAYGIVEDKVEYPMKYAISELTTVEDTRTDNKGFWEVGKFCPNMMVGTFRSGGTKKVYEWQEGTTAIIIGSDDFFFFGFNITNKGNIFLDYTNVRMRMTVDGVSYHLPIYRYSPTGSEGYPAGETIGPVGLDTAPVFYLSPADFKDILKTTSDKTVTLQVINASYATGEVLSILSSPLSLTIRYSSFSASGSNGYPSFGPQLTPDWNQELITE